MVSNILNIIVETCILIFLAVWFKTIVKNTLLETVSNKLRLQERIGKFIDTYMFPIYLTFLLINLSFPMINSKLLRT